MLMRRYVFLVTVASIVIVGIFLVQRERETLASFPLFAIKAAPESAAKSESTLGADGGVSPLWGETTTSFAAAHEGGNTDVETRLPPVTEIPSPSAPDHSPANAPKNITLPAPINGGDIFMLTNSEREKLGLVPLRLSARLAAIAEVKARDMFERQYFAHEAPDGADAGMLADRFGYAYVNVGENLALGGFTGSANVVTNWMESPGHRANILSEIYTEIGIYALSGTWEGKKAWFVVQEFGRPLSDCPSPDETLKQVIAIYENELTALDRTLTNAKAQIDAERVAGTLEPTTIDDYNHLVLLHSDLSATTTALIDRYNGEVKAFNVCAGAE